MISLGPYSIYEPNRQLANFLMTISTRFRLVRWFLIRTPSNDEKTYVNLLHNELKKRNRLWTLWTAPRRTTDYRHEALKRITCQMFTSLLMNGFWLSVSGSTNEPMPLTFTVWNWQLTQEIIVFCQSLSLAKISNTPSFTARNVARCVHFTNQILQAYGLLRYTARPTTIWARRSERKPKMNSTA